MQVEAVTIMVVEDDQLVQGIVEEALREGGFESAITASGAEAIALLQGEPAKYRALITDISLLGEHDGRSQSAPERSSRKFR